MKAKKYVFASLLLMGISCLCLSTNELKPKLAEAATVKNEYAVALSEYTIEGYDESVTVYAPDGSVLETDGGKFICKDLGVYTIVKNGKTLKEIQVIYKSFDTTFSYAEEVKDEVRTNEKFVLPKAEIFTDYQSFDTYSISIEKDGETFEDFTSVSDALEYVFTVSGEYTITYSVVDMYGLTATDENVVHVLKSKDIVGTNISETICVLNEVDFSKVEGLYEGKSYPVDIQIFNAQNQEEALSNRKFLPVKTGMYKAVFTCEFPDETVVREVSFEVILAEGSLFSNGTNITGVTLNEDTAKKKGLEITASGTGASIYYNQMIDLSQFNSDDKLISFYVPYNEYSDMQDIRVTLIDAMDEDNQISVYWRRSKSVGWEHITYCLVEFNGYALGIDNEKGTNLPREVYGAVMVCSFLRENYSFNFTYDQEENALYSWRSATNKIKLLDLDDTEALKNYRIWNGFSSNYIYMKIDFIANVQSAVQIESIGGINLKTTGNEIVDENYLQFDYRGQQLTQQSGKMLNAYVGQTYHLPTPITENLFGDITVDFNLLVDSGSGFVQSKDKVENYTFKPSVAGDYQAIYGYYDLYGNYQTKTFAFTVSADSAPNINIYGGNVTADIMSYSLPPQVSVAGGTGEVQTNIVYTYNGKEVQPNEDGKFFLNEKGYVEMLVTAVDEIGVTAEMLFYIVVNAELQYIAIDEIPHSYISGREYVLPDFTATDYSLNEGEDGYNMAKSIYVDGVLLGSDRKFTCPMGVSSITVRYYGGEGTAKEICQELVIDVVDNGAENIVSLDNLFHLPTGVEGELFEFGYAIDFNSDISLDYANLLTARELNISISFLQNATAYTDVTFTLTDFLNEKQSIVVAFRNLSEKTADMYVNGKLVGQLKGLEGVYASGAYKGQKYSTYSFYLLDYKAMLTDDARNQFCLLDTYASGKAYEGFDSGKVKLTLSMGGCSGASTLIVNGLSNQNFTTYAIRNGMDKTGPSIAIVEEFAKKYYYGDTISLPAAVAQDVLQGQAYGIDLTITTPSGNKVSKNGEEWNTLSLNEYGTYKFEYVSYDYFGNSAKTEYFVIIKDTQKPQIIVANEIPAEVQVGETLSFTNYTATDNIGVVLECVYIKTPQSLLLRTDGTYTFKAAGVYSVIYFAKDAEGNDCAIIYQVTVK